MQEHKRFKIPRQIDSSLYIWRFIRLKDLILLTPPVLISVVLFLYIFPNLSFQIRFFFSMLPTISVACLIFIRPISERGNITLFDYLRYRAEFNQRQRIYYFKKLVRK
ncbi:hypothetical protein C1X05_14850 [Laceyella sacchari]|uniref:Conjugal transfer protein n=1 Tax=Laceyella tengchongensis TaxID=574699 RepID=A0AA45WPL7_9BACL|nr:hypothetical protein [Laceyella tengchongensis]AUS09978.1 hypothetical protein C1X05_14850 [Laceyella sacchari]MRG27525.1 hypothetical protein [Laceyella tengchongensis]SMP22321.1 hypothetical protein SAMN06265361_10441 [Laceyella tengchongensis]